MRDRREIDTLFEALEELECSEAQIVTAWEEETIVVDAKTITGLPAYKGLLQQ
ncbi:MAG: ATPase, partial [Methanocorpusculum parvum]|nr:ATPase [Methanocorpusculum parvum]